MDFFSAPELKRIHDKIIGRERLDESEGVYILESNDILPLGILADRVRREKAGDFVTFVNNFHICFTNICGNNCLQCRFKRGKNDADAFLLSLDEIREKASEAKRLAVPEVLLMGGIHPDVDFDFCVDAVRTIKETIPDVMILAYSAVEIKHFAGREQKDPKEILRILKGAGLTAITGGGMDFLDDSYIERLGCDENRSSSEDWIYIHKSAHGMGIATNACMIYGAGETDGEIVENMSKLRTIQDETGGFTHFFPYGYGQDGKKMTDGLYDLKMLILARLYLDNFDHIRVYWGYVGKRLAQISLLFGVDDLNGVRQKGRIIHTSGNIAPAVSNEEEMKSIIRGAGRIPAERDILFNKVRIFDDT